MGKIAWFEIRAKETGRARKFYGELLGWQFQPFDGAPDYQIAHEAGGAIQPANGHDGVLVYFDVADVNQASARVRDLGGEAGEPQEIPNVGAYAVCVDTEGNRFGLYQDAPSG
jgi:predicted enzyme related to lactoylglutathione lyase